MGDFNPETKNKHMRRFAYISLFSVIGLTLVGLYTGKWAPDYVYLAFTGNIIAWAGFSKWGEIKDKENGNS